MTRPIPLWIGAALLATFASCNPTLPPGSDLPGDAFGRTGDPLPEGAVEVSEEEYNTLVAAGLWKPLTPRTDDEQAAAEVAQDQLDEITIAAYLAANPGVEGLVPPNPTDDSDMVEPLADGNFVLSLTLRNGDNLEVVTMGERFWRRTVAEARRRFAARDNQMTLYRELFNGIPENWRNVLELPQPDEIDDDGGMDADAIRSLTGRIASADVAPSIIADINLTGFAFAPPAHLSDCDQAIGATPGGDLRDSRFDGTCELDPNGIVARYDWSLRDHITCVKSQGDRGTCTGFANTATIETLASITHGLHVNLSEQAYYNRARTVWDNPGNSIDGHTSEIGFREMYEEGFLLYFENQWPYNPSSFRVTTCTKFSSGSCVAATYTGSCIGYSDTCSNTIHQSSIGCYEALAFVFCSPLAPNKNPDFNGFRIGHSAQFWDPTDKSFSMQVLKLSITLNRPVVIGFPITGALSAAAAGNGFLNYVPSDTIGGGHGMMVAGFIDNEDLSRIVPTAPLGAGGGYLIVKNSWGNCSGDGGFLYIPYQSVLDYTGDMTVLYYIL